MFLLRGGITGLAITQECADDDCPETGLSLEKPAFMSAEDNNALSVVGVLIIVISALMISEYAVIALKKRKKQREEQENP